jgi:cystathionine beta-lyase
MSGFMVSFDFVSGVKQDAITFLEKLQLFTLAESLGGVESWRIILLDDPRFHP